jgi:hypothetical protein
MSNYRTPITAALLLTVLVGASVLADAQDGTKSRKSKRKPDETWMAVNSWEPEEGSPFFKYTRQLPVVTRVELRLVRSEQGQAHILASKVLLNDEAEQFARVWRGLRRGGGSLSFTPEYQLEFYSGDELLLKTDVCFHCRNLTLPNGGNHQEWGFDAKGKTGQALLKLLKALLPSPMA